MTTRNVYSVIAILVASFLVTAACSSGGDEVENAAPVEAPETVEESDVEEESDGEGPNQNAIVDSFAMMNANHNAQIRLECQCRPSTHGFETKDECSAGYMGGVEDLDGQEECIAEAVDTLGKPPQGIYDYFECAAGFEQAGIQCLEDDLDAENCDRVDHVNTIGWVEDCKDAEPGAFGACENYLADIGMEAEDWMMEVDELVMECFGSDET